MARNLVKYASIGEIVNSISVIIPTDGFVTAADIKGLLEDIYQYCTEKVSCIKKGELGNLKNITDSIKNDTFPAVRFDTEAWVANLFCEINEENIILFSGSLGRLIISSSAENNQVILSDINVDVDELSNLSKKLLDSSVKKLRSDAGDNEKYQAILIMGSGRLHDSFQALIYAAEYFLKHPSKKEEVRVVLIKGHFLLSVEDVYRATGIVAEFADMSEIIKWKNAPKISVIESLNWHRPKSSIATIGRITELIRHLFPKRTPLTSRRGLFISLELEKRIWIEQHETLKAAIRFARQHLGINAVLVNGMTAPPFLAKERPFFEDIRKVECEFIEGLSYEFGDLKFSHLHGYALVEKLEAVMECKYFISPVGSAALIPLAIEVPGICFGTREFLEASAVLLPSDRENVCIFDAKKVISIEEDLSIEKYSWSTKTPQGRSYSINIDEFKAIFEKHCLEILLS